jgi:hypothetical protein
MQLRWQVYPKNQPPSSLVREVVEVFEAAMPEIGTPENQKSSNQALGEVVQGLRALGFMVEDQPKAGSAEEEAEAAAEMAVGAESEKGQETEKRKKKVAVTVLFGENGKAEKTFNVDAWHEVEGAVIEVEAGSAVDARKVYQDLFEAGVIPNVAFLGIAVMNAYYPNRLKKDGKKPIDDYQRAKKIFDTLFVSQSQVPFSTLLLIGY